MVVRVPDLQRLCLVLLICLVTFSAAGASAGTKDNVSLLAVVNEDSILTTDIEAGFNAVHSSMTTEDKETFDYRKLLNKTVNDRLIVQEAEALGMDEENSLSKLMGKRKREYAIAAFLRAKFVPEDSVTDSEVRDYFLANFGKKRLRTVSVSTKEEASQLLAKVRRGADMDSIAKAVSLDIYRYRGGLNPVTYALDLDPELAKPASSLKEKEVAGPFPLVKVFAFLRLEQSLPPDTSEISKVQPRIVATLKTEKRNRSWHAFLQDLRKDSPVFVDSSALAAISHTDNIALDSNFMKGSSKVVAVIARRDTITDFDLRQKVAHQRMAANTLGVDSLVRQTLDETITDIGLYHAAERAGFDKQPAVVKKLVNTRDSALVEMYLNETVVSKIKFSHQEFEAYYKTHLDDFRESQQLNLKQIMVGTRGAADSIVSLIGEGADFDFVAKKILKGQTNIEEKDKWTSMDVFPVAIQADLAKLPSGGITKPYATTDGWVIFKVKERRQGKIKPQADVEMQIRDVIFQNKFDALLDKTLTILKKNSHIVYFNDAIDRYFGKEQSK